METVDEGQNGNKFLKLVNDEGGVDRISLLRDCLLVEILTRLPSTKYAIITGTLSKRWKHLWTLVHTLIFTQPDNLITEGDQSPNTWSDFASCVDKTLTQCRQLKLKKFQVHIDCYTSYDIRFQSQFNNWIRYAVTCNVDQLNLKFWCVEEEHECLLDQSIFVNSCFTDLRLEACVLNPSGAIRWKNLKNLCLCWMKIDEELMGNILSGSPLLETLVLRYCCGPRRLDITSKSIKNLVLHGYHVPKAKDEASIIEINAPNILSLKIQGGMVFRKLLLINMSSLIQANLDYLSCGYRETTKRETREEMLKELILNLRHVKELKIGYWCSRDLSRLEAKGFTITSNVKLPHGRYI